MHIGLVAPEAVPPKFYGGRRVVSWLAEELVRQGHQVTLFASGDSETTAHLVACAPQALRLAGIRDHVANTLSMLLTLAFASMWMMNAALGQSDLRSRQELACQDDVYRLCPDEIPDEARVASCMARQKAKLSPGCRAMFTQSPRHR